MCDPSRAFWWMDTTDKPTGRSTQDCEEACFIPISTIISVLQEFVDFAKVMSSEKCVDSVLD